MTGSGWSADICLICRGMHLKDWFRALRSLWFNGDRSSRDAQSPDAVVIGMQLARAMQAQDRRDDLRGSQSSLLADLRYSDEEIRLWRWVESPVDRAIESIVTDFAGLVGLERKALRDSLTLDDFYTLIAFVRRCALSALRTDEAARIGLAFTATAMIARSRIDWRDLTVAICLLRYAGQRLNAPVEDMADRAARLADPQTAEALLMDRNKQIKLAESCGYWEAATSQGVALFGTGHKHFSPTADLSGIVFAAALALEDEGYKVSDIKVAADLPLVWLNSREGSALARMVRRFPGCASIHGVLNADPAPGTSGQSLLVFLAEAASVSDAREVAHAAAQAADAEATVIGLASGRLCAVVIQRSYLVNTPPLEDVRSLERLRPVIEPLLR